MPTHDDEAMQLSGAPESGKMWEEVVDKELVSPEKIMCDWMLPVNWGGFAQSKVVKTCIGKVRDAFILDNLLTPKECEELRAATEKVGYTFWNTAPNASSDFRSAFTIECRHTLFADCIWNRAKPFLPESITVTEDDDRAERDLMGTWIPTNVNPHLLFGKYGDKGHFGPHTDGSTVNDINNRTLLTLLIYLQTTEKGGETTLLSDEQMHNPIPRDATGRYEADSKYIVDSVKPVEGRALFFYKDQMHSAAAVGDGHTKYILRTDIFFTRIPPILTNPNDREAFEIWQKAQLVAEKDAVEATRMFRRCFKLSPDFADLMGM